MIVFPLKWLPYILTVSGLLWLMTEGNAAALIPLAIGGVWLYYIYKNKKSSGPRGTASSAPVHKAPAQQNPTVSASAGAASTANPDVCPNCKSQIGAGMSFCSKCGTRVR